MQDRFFKEYDYIRGQQSIAWAIQLFPMLGLLHPRPKMSLFPTILQAKETAVSKLLEELNCIAREGEIVAYKAILYNYVT